MFCYKSHSGTREKVHMDKTREDNKTLCAASMFISHIGTGVTAKSSVILLFPSFFLGGVTLLAIKAIIHSRLWNCRVVIR